MKTGKQARQASVWRDLRSLVVKIAVIAVAATLAFTLVYGVDRNREPGMDPAVKDGDLVMYFRLDKDYVAGDLLALSYQGKAQVRRVVARSGDTVDITDDGLLVNGSLQQEPNISEKTQRYEEGIDFPVTLGTNQVFVLGDARENATDSRIYGPVNTGDTRGTVITLVRRRNL